MSSHSSTKVVLAAGGANLGIALVKGVAAIFTGSAAMASEAIHSVVDTCNQILLLVGIKRSNRPADASHPYGYHREIYIWAFVVALALFFGGGLVSAIHGVEKLFHPEEVSYLGWNLAIYAAAFAFEGFALWTAIKEFNKSRGNMPVLEALRKSTDPALYVVLVEDTVALGGLTLAFIGTLITLLTGWLWVDGVTSLLIGLGLMISAGFLFMETLSLASGESASKSIQDGIRRIVGRQSSIININELLTVHQGPNYVHVDISVDFVDSKDAGYVEDVIDDVKREIRARYPIVKKVFIAVEDRHDHMREAA